MLLNYAEFISDPSNPGSDDPQTLIILHGLFGSMRNWQTIAKYLSQQFRVITVDQRNHGDSPHLPEMDYQIMADDLLLMMQELGIDRAHILGHSMGGKVSMVASLLAPELVQSLTVVDIAPVSYRHGFEGIVSALQTMPLDQISSRSEADQWLSSRIPTLSLRQFLLQNLVKQDDLFDWRVNLPVISESIVKLSDFPNTGEETCYEGPTLFVGGADSEYIRSDHLGAMQKLFPQHELVYVADAGHWPHVENPGDFFSHLDPFLAKYRA